jgi:hypothetical protein
MKNILVIFTMVASFVFQDIQGCNIVVADDNIQIGQKNITNTKRDNNFPNTKVDEKFASTVCGAPDETFATLIDLQSAYPWGGNSKNKLVSANGHIYYWNGFTWTDAGIQYFNTKISNGGITLKQLSNMVAIGKNLFNKQTVTNNCYLVSSTGIAIEGRSGTGLNVISDYIKVKPKTSYARTSGNIIFYDINFNFISGISLSTTSFATPANCEYIKISIKSLDINTTQIEKGLATTTYESYAYKISGLGIDTIAFMKLRKQFSEFYNVYLRFATISATKSGTTITVNFNPTTTNVNNNLYLYYNTLNYKFINIELPQKTYKLAHNEYLAIDITTGIIATKNVTNTDNNPKNVLLLLNIYGNIVSGGFGNLIIENNINKPVIVINNNLSDGSSIVRSMSNSVFDFNIKATYVSDHTFVGEELWIFNASDDVHTDYANVNRYAVDVENKVATFVGSFKHNWGHVNTIDYCGETDTLICGNGSSSYLLTGQIYILSYASTFKDVNKVDLNSHAIIIDVADQNWGAKLNVLWGESNNNKFNICYAITDDNKNIRKIMLGQGNNQLERGTFIDSKIGLEFNGTYKVLATYSQKSGIDVNQGSVYYNGFLYTAIGHSGIWVVKNRLNEDGKITSEQLKDYMYNETGTLLTSPYSEGIDIRDGLMYCGGSDGKIRVYRID